MKSARRFITPAGIAVALSMIVILISLAAAPLHAAVTVPRELSRAVAEALEL